MADEIKKRGRPAKQVEEKTVVNEGERRIQMSEKEIDEKLSADMVRERWSKVFSQYADRGYNNIVNSWGAAMTQLNNPFLQNMRIKNSLSSSRKTQQEDLQKALENPENSELTFQGLSMWLYYTNYVYNVLVKLNRDTPSYNYYYIPNYVEASDCKTEAFKKESQKVDKILKAFKPNLTFKTIATQVSLEGKASYLPRLSYDNKDVDFFVMQKLNTNMIKLTGFGSQQQFIASFNMAIFLQPAYSISQYPKFIRETWEKMVSTGLVSQNKQGGWKLNPSKVGRGEINGILEGSQGNYMYWVQLPQDLCYTFYTDGSHANVFPDFVGIFNDLNDLDDYRWLQASLLSKGVTSVLTGVVPIIKDPKAGSDSTVITPDTIMGYQDLFSNSVSNNILPFFSPFTNMQLHTIDSQPEALDIIFDRTRDLIATSGNSALMSITDKPSIASVKASELIQAARTDYLTRQFESFLNEVINRDFDLKFTWKISLWGDIFYQRDDQKNLKEMVVSGMEGMIPKLLSSHGMTVEDYLSSKYYMDALGIKVEKVLEEETKEAEMEAEAAQVGRPALDEDEIENENSGKSRDEGNNVSETKDFDAEEGEDEE